ncbi:MAG: M23 family metallopeptidase [Spirochaetales bacterium]
MKKVLVYTFSILFMISSIFFNLSGCQNNSEINDDDTNTDDILSTYFDLTLQDGTLEFTSSIMDSEDFSRIIPLGQINPPGHTFPTDHIYFVLNGLSKPVYAPTAGKVLYIDEPGMYGDRAIRIGVTSTMSYYLGHIFIEDGLEVGDTVLTGEQIGTSGNTSCVDFGVLNKDIENNFISDKYPVTTIYGDKPLYYYNEPLRTELYALVKPPQPYDEPEYVYDGGVTDGEFVLDELGTLSGNWFKENCLNSDGWYEWEDTLAFGYDNFYTDQIRIAIGTYSNAFALNNEDDPMTPISVTTTSGAVAYYLYNANNTSKGLPTSERTGLMMVEMLSDTRIKLEIFEDTTSLTREFTSSALYYVR